MKSGLGISPTMRLLLSILAQIAAQMRTWYNDNMAITFFLSNIFCWKVSYFAPLGESSQKQVLLQNNSIRKSIKLIRGAKEVQGESCCIAGSAIHPVWLAGELVREFFFFSYKNSATGFRRLNFCAVGIIFVPSGKIKIKKVIQDFFFFGFTTVDMKKQLRCSCDRTHNFFHRHKLSPTSYFFLTLIKIRIRNCRQKFENSNLKKCR